MANMVYKSDKKYDKIKHLVKTSEYAKHWGLDRSGIYDLLDSGRLTRYVIVKPGTEENEDKFVEIEALLDLDETPEVKRYGDRPEITAKSDEDK
jgi:hypothetical protein